MMLHPTRRRPQEARDERRDVRRDVQVVAYRACLSEGLADAETRCEAHTITVPEEIVQ